MASELRFWLLELRVSQHFSTFYGPSVQAMDTQLCARHRRWTPNGSPRSCSTNNLRLVAWWLHDQREKWYVNSGQILLMDGDLLLEASGRRPRSFFSRSCFARIS